MQVTWANGAQMSVLDVVQRELQTCREDNKSTVTRWHTGIITPDQRLGKMGKRAKQPKTQINKQLTWPEVLRKRHSCAHTLSKNVQQQGGEIKCRSAYKICPLIQVLPGLLCHFQVTGGKAGEPSSYTECEEEIQGAAELEAVLGDANTASFES